MRTLFTYMCILFVLVGCSPERQQVKDSASAAKQVPGTGAAGGEQAEAQQGAEAANLPPRIVAVDVTPLMPKTGDTIKVEVSAADPEGNNISLHYAWTKNGEPIGEHTNVLVLDKDFKRGDVVELIVTPEDAKSKGQPGRMVVTVGNAPPQIISTPSEGRSENNVFSYQVKATDAEKDSLVYSLQTAPSGMSIDQSSGLITWTMPAENRDKATVSVLVKDGHGGEALQSFVLDISSKR